MDYRQIAMWQMELERIAMTNIAGQPERAIDLRARQLEILDLIANERMKPTMSTNTDGE
jgi:hypothetical protein